MADTVSLDELYAKAEALADENAGTGDWPDVLRHPSIGDKVRGVVVDSYVKNLSKSSFPVLRIAAVDSTETGTLDPTVIKEFELSGFVLQTELADVAGEADADAMKGAVITATFLGERVSKKSGNTYKAWKAGYVGPVAETIAIADAAIKAEGEAIPANTDDDIEF